MNLQPGDSCDLSLQRGYYLVSCVERSGQEVILELPANFVERTGQDLSEGKALWLSLGGEDEMAEVISSKEVDPPQLAVRLHPEMPDVAV